MLRDSFVKYRKKSLPSGSAGGSQKEWKYTEIMSFLLPFIQPRSSKSNLSQLHYAEERPGTPQSLSGSEGRSSTPQQQPPTSPAPSTSAPAPSTSRSRSPRDRPSRAAVAAQARESRRGRRTDTDIGERLMSLLEQPVPKPPMPDGELDEAYHFALSTVPMLLRLNMDTRQQAKLEIMTLLINHERRQTSQRHLHPPALAQTSHPPQVQQPQGPMPHPTPGHSSHFHPIHPAPPPQSESFRAMLHPDWEDPNCYSQSLLRFYGSSVVRALPGHFRADEG
ncbi:hypothetical protein D5F01_LYC20663 [Larimichthys crocea]|uniref:BESS domain-containing protein n=1 Tax=Larimichthys crocea TaxID=215358 RepID=A0A6G0HRF9_LARCR|nr:hypothetical protein D5F01_LYC20663 [Larimichthys crocea]